MKMPFKGLPGELRHYGLWLPSVLILMGNCTSNAWSKSSRLQRQQTLRIHCQKRPFFI